MSRRQVKALAWCGIAIPIIDVVFTVWLASKNPGYSHVSQYISELGESGRPYEWLYFAWSIAYAILMAGFAFALWGGLRGHSGAGRVLAALLVLAAANFVGAVFPCDPGCDAVSLSGLLHVASGGLCLIATIAAPFWTYAAMKGSDTWPAYRPLTLIVGWLLVGSVVWLILCYVVDLTPGLAGVAQRVSMFVFYVWIEILSLRLASWPNQSEAAIS